MYLLKESRISTLSEPDMTSSADADFDFFLPAAESRDFVSSFSGPTISKDYFCDDIAQRGSVT